MTSPLLCCTFDKYYNYMTEIAQIISHYFSREVSRTKVLRTGQVHVAFSDGTMSVYSPKDLESFQDEMLWAQHVEQTRVNAYIDSQLKSNNRALIPF